MNNYMKIKKNVAITETGVIFNAGTGDSYSVNQPGMLIMEMIQDGKDKDEILAKMTEEYEVDKNRAETDLTDFLNYLAQLKLVDHGE